LREESEENNEKCQEGRTVPVSATGTSNATAVHRVGV